MNFASHYFIYLHFWNILEKCEPNLIIMQLKLLQKMNFVWIYVYFPNL